MEDCYKGALYNLNATLRVCRTFAVPCSLILCSTYVIVFVFLDTVCDCATREPFQNPFLGSALLDLGLELQNHTLHRISTFLTYSSTRSTHSNYAVVEGLWESAQDRLERLISWNQNGISMVRFIISSCGLAQLNSSGVGGRILDSGSRFL